MHRKNKAHVTFYSFPQDILQQYHKQVIITDAIHKSWDFSHFYLYFIHVICEAQYNRKMWRLLFKSYSEFQVSDESIKPGPVWLPALLLGNGQSLKPWNQIRHFYPHFQSTLMFLWYLHFTITPEMPVAKIGYFERHAGI